jgi:DNA-binding IclR family transcriptional regulator
MAHTYEELKGKTVAQLREIAAGLEHEAVKGHSQMNKEHLLKALCTALTIEMHVHHEVVGLNKSEIKAKIRQLRKKRDDAIATHTRAELKMIRRRIHCLKRMIHKAAV